MPKRQLSSPAVADDYDSDVPASKKAKSAKSAKNHSTAASKPGKGAKAGKSSDGEPFWEVSHFSDISSQKRYLHHIETYASITSSSSQVPAASASPNSKGK